MAGKTTTKYKPNNLFISFLYYKGFEKEKGFPNTYDEYFVHKKNKNMVKIIRQRQIKLLDKHGFTLYNDESVTNTTLDLFFNNNLKRNENNNRTT